MGRNKKYPYYLKKIEVNKSTDQNFFKIIGPKSYIHVSVPYNGQFSVSKYISEIKSYSTDKDFKDTCYIDCSEAKYQEVLNEVSSYLGNKSEITKINKKQSLNLRSMKPIIPSILDLDRYKLTMGQFIFFFYPKQRIRCSFTCRTKDEQVRKNLVWLIPYINEQFELLSKLRLSFSEMLYMQNTGIYRKEYIDYLSQLELSKIKAEVIYVEGVQQLGITYEGDWSEKILFETYALSIVAELYSKKVALDKWVSKSETPLTENEYLISFSQLLEGTKMFKDEILKPYYDEAMKRLDVKIDLYQHHPIIKFFEFGTRRRFSQELQEKVVLKLNESFHKPQFMGTSQFIGTSNEYLAFKHGLKAGGTSAHEMDMAIAALNSDDPEKMINSIWDWRREWAKFYGYDLSVCLTDTFGSDWFFKNCPKDIAEMYSFREDSAVNLFDYTDNVLDLYKRHNINPLDKVIVHSNGLTALKVINIANYKAGEINKCYGQGTDLSCDVGNDYKHISIVIKLTAVEKDGKWVSTVKLSDNLAKAIGEPSEIEKYKRIFGYVNELTEAQTY